MKYIATEYVVLSHEEVATLLRARHIIEKIADNSPEADAFGIACAITDYIDILNNYYTEEDF